MSSSLHAKFILSIAYLARGMHKDLSIKERHLPLDSVLIMKSIQGKAIQMSSGNWNLKAFFGLLFWSLDSGKSQMHH